MADLVNALSPLSLDEDTSISLSALGTNLLADGLGDLREVTVSISTGFDSAADELTFTNPLPGGITAAYNDATGVLTLSGEASEADYEAALAGITYANTAGADAKEITVAITEFANNGDVVFFNGSFYELVEQQLGADAAAAAAGDDDHVAFWRNQRVLELGCGTGLVSIALARLGRRRGGWCLAPYYSVPRRLMST